MVLMYSDGVTEAEDGYGRPFDEDGVQSIMAAPGLATPKEVGWALFSAVEAHTEQRRLLDDLTVLVVKRLPPLPAV
jgi:serine phosphatase RsbU (regulator of sigma subunit)